MPSAVGGVERANDAFVVTTDHGAVHAASVVIATGGLTVPKIGATPFGYKVAAQFGLNVVPPRPALVPLALAPDALARYGDLAGVALDVEVSCNGGRFREALLFTHRGLSGPAILQISSYWEGKAPLAIDLLPGADAAAWFRSQHSSTAHVDNVLAQSAAATVRAAVVCGAWRVGADVQAGRSPVRRDRDGTARLDAATSRARSATTRPR